MNANLDLSGTYYVNGRKLVNPEKPFFLVLSQRKSATGNKPPTYVVAKTATGHPFETGEKDQYISSVYPVPGQPFSRIEYQGVQFSFEYQATGAEIRQMAGNNNSHL